MARSWVWLAAALAVVGVSGCGSAPAPRATVLSLGSSDPAGIEHDPGMTTFVRDVSRLSRGALRIAIDGRWYRGSPQDGPQPGRESQLLRGVVRGVDDLGWAHTRAFDRLGPTSLRALDAPLLIDDHATQAAVLRSALPARMLAELRPVGVVGLGLLAGRIERPAGRGRPLRAASDYRAATLRTHDSAAHDGLARVLGARPAHDIYQQVGYRWHERRIGGLEDDLDTLFFEPASFPSGPPEPHAWVTTNVGFAAATAALVANPRRLRALGATQRGWLRAAAASATQASLHESDDERLLARELCAIGVRLAVASRAQIATLRRAVRPLRERLRRDRKTRAAIAQITALARRADRSSAPAPPTCAAAAGGLAGPAAAGGSSIPDGVYRVRMTRADLRAAGATTFGDTPGTLTLTLRAGRWRLTQAEPAGRSFGGTYGGDRLRTQWSEPQGLDARLSVAVDAGGLRFFVPTAGDYRFYRSRFTAHRWARVGD
jgi:TRAP-type C4-dicarboxylate transport system substrate-binding protein